jgi:TPR repeat protein
MNRIPFSIVLLMLFTIPTVFSTGCAPLPPPSTAGSSYSAAPTETAEQQFYRGFDYYKAQNYAEALKWYHKAADQGEARAQANLGFMYNKGQGVTQDNIEAIKWYQKAAIQGHANEL